MNQYEENDGKLAWEWTLKVSRKILYKESKRIPQRILVRTLCLFYKFKGFEHLKDDEKNDGKPPWERRLKVSRTILFK